MEACKEAHKQFRPFAVETFGGLAGQAREFLKEVASEAAKRTRRHRVEVFNDMKAAVSAAVVKGVARAAIRKGKVLVEKMELDSEAEQHSQEERREREDQEAMEREAAATGMEEEVAEAAFYLTGMAALAAAKAAENKFQEEAERRTANLAAAAVVAAASAAAKAAAERVDAEMGEEETGSGTVIQNTKAGPVRSGEEGGARNQGAVDGTENNQTATNAPRGRTSRQRPRQAQSKHTQPTGSKPRTHREAKPFFRRWSCVTRRAVHHRATHHGMWSRKGRPSSTHRSGSRG
eukprot:TRINITY_DN4468_c0_g1_i1.p1 TRINITY_DN4468_c0_g1~~TRINITY_DN4468_c0_g1_i1.p1  ORF type:complete len:291 (+),score=75.27 TRINITY_DN4468_c0_g1_i1:38-910(+)